MHCVYFSIQQIIFCKNRSKLNVKQNKYGSFQSNSNGEWIINALLQILFRTNFLVSNLIYIQIILKLESNNWHIITSHILSRNQNSKTLMKYTNSMICLIFKIITLYKMQYCFIKYGFPYTYNLLLAFIV